MDRFAKILALCIFCCPLLLSAPRAISGEQLQNQVADHPSPYLALHGSDPVAWQEWTPETVSLARQQGKLLYLSVGYFSCHWCHVMQRESYQNQGIAALLNDHFVPVKIDRELEPALDQRLMDFAQRTLGRGGWPLNVFITPEGYPVYAVLYLPPDNFRSLLLKLDAVWNAEPEKLSELVRNEIKTVFPDALPQLDTERTADLLAAAPDRMLQRADTLAGGFGQQNKFPSTVQLGFLLEQRSLRADDKSAEFLRLTLDNMAQRGMRDHLDGGFFRYSTDPNWELPHFEKMLYDNALLARLYLRAAEVLESETYRAIARDTLDFMQRRMLTPEGGLVGSFSAVDNHEIEGGYYLWQASELKQLLDSDEYALFTRAWDMDHPAELEAGNLPRQELTAPQLAAESGRKPAEIEQLLHSAKNKLLAARVQRVLPVDNKLLAGWNGLALSTFAHAASKLDDAEYRATARNIRDFLVNKLYDGEKLARAWAGGKLLGSASLQDYAYVSQGLLEWAKVADSAEDYRLAHQLAQQGWQQFHRDNGWLGESDSLLAPAASEEVVTESATPSPPAVLIRTSLMLAERFDDRLLRQRALSALNRRYDVLEHSPFWFTSRLDALQYALSLPKSAQ